ncbi:MAG: folate family ECF transporter S component [Clostridia bacterium]|nr:folate family ECF transporter S component [Clostridia bacterium]
MQKNVKFITVTAILIALKIVFDRFLSFSVWNQRIGLSFIAVALAAYLFGIYSAVLVGAIGDFLGAILFPQGQYFFGFTATAALIGLIFALGLFKDQKPLKIVLCVLSNQIICTLLLNSLWISILYGAPFSGMIVSRIPQAILMTVVQTAVLCLFFLPKSPIAKQLNLLKQN